MRRASDPRIAPGTRPTWLFTRCPPPCLPAEPAARRCRARTRCRPCRPLRAVPVPPQVRTECMSGWTPTGAAGLVQPAAAAAASRPPLTTTTARRLNRTPARLAPVTNTRHLNQPAHEIKPSPCHGAAWVAAAAARLPRTPSATMSRALPGWHPTPSATAPWPRASRCVLARMLAPTAAAALNTCAVQRRD